MGSGRLVKDYFERTPESDVFDLEPINLRLKQMLRLCLAAFTSVGWFLIGHHMFTRDLSICRVDLLQTVDKPGHSREVLLTNRNGSEERILIRNIEVDEEIVRNDHILVETKERRWCRVMVAPNSENLPERVFFVKDLVFAMLSPLTHSVQIDQKVRTEQVATSARK